MCWRNIRSAFFCGYNLKRSSLSYFLSFVLSSATLAADNTVEIEVTGSIKPYCATNSTVLPLHIGDITRPGAMSASFIVDCNAPFQYSLQSENGAMLLKGAPRGENEIPYDVRVRIPLTRGGEINDTCKSAALRTGAVTCKFSDSGGKIALSQRAEASVNWLIPDQQLFGGQYHDNLKIFLNLRP